MTEAPPPAATAAPATAAAAAAPTPPTAHSSGPDEERVVEVTLNSSTTPKKDDKKEKKDEKKEGEKEGKRWCEVIVHVYDLSQDTNNKLFRLGLGLYHSGVELEELDREYWFQGHDQRYTGVLEIDHPTALRAIPHVRESVSLGRTARTREQIAQIIDRLTLDYRGCTYNVLRRNCNAFSADLVKALEPEKRFPGYINRLANMGSGLMRALPDSLLWWGIGKLGLTKADMEVTPQDESQEPCIDDDGTVTTVEVMQHQQQQRQQQQQKRAVSADASYQSLAGASEGVGLLDMRGRCTQEAAASAAQSSGLYGPVHLMPPAQQREFTRTMFEVSLEQMEMRMLEEQQMQEYRKQQEELDKQQQEQKEQKKQEKQEKERKKTPPPE